MACEPREFLAVARELHQGAQNTEEAKLRSAISRAYYAAFLYARDAACIADLSSTVHALTRQHYSKIGEAKVALRLDSLRVSRNDADYEMALSFNKIKSNHAIDIAQRVIEHIEKLQA
ncbi:HEPN domain-containing protein [Burkholderia sp. AU19243]|uniref:HEPN domain-containing protein n=1 Tax=Burkholderia sp. AU19243 TaxID=2824810 RepID=UPI001B971839|nr:HEPN domain-containing protein [Burkholderia sp. AU19243]MBR8366923.1 HEPN domain-containing protein [Burkholderia sp. AU19243]